MLTKREKSQFQNTKNTFSYWNAKFSDHRHRTRHASYALKRVFQRAKNRHKYPQIPPFFTKNDHILGVNRDKNNFSKVKYKIENGKSRFEFW